MSDKKRVLFVDDEKSILDGLRRMLRTYRDEWDMEFAVSGEEALGILDRVPIDVVVSDVRMPGMDGLEFLEKVRDTHPSIARIVLSGYSERGDTMRATGIAHQYLAKPCEPELLRLAVDRSSGIRGTFENPRLKAAIAETKSLPSLPTLYNEVSAELAGPDPSLARVAHIVGRDIGMASKVIQIVNSSFFGLRREITNPEQAVAMLGIDTIMALVMTVHVFDQAQADALPAGFLDRLWSRSMVVATTAKAIAKDLDLEPGAVDESYLAGMLHDCGSLVLATNFPDAYRTGNIPATGDATEMIHAELAAFGADHAAVGGYLMGLWGLPDSTVEAVAFHHAPSSTPALARSPLTAVHAAVAIESRSGKNPPAPDLGYLEAVGVADRLDRWVDLAEGLASERETS